MKALKILAENSRKTDNEEEKTEETSKLLIGRKRRRNSLNRSSRNAERIKNYKTPFIIILNI